MNLERDRFLTEAMGVCWHELNDKYTRPHCIKCGKNEFDNPNFNLENYKYNFSTWSGFGILWEFAIKQEWWDYFLKAKLHIGEAVGSEWDYYFDVDKITPDKFADAIYEFLKEKK